MVRATFEGSGTSTVSASAMSSTRMTASGASPRVPMTSSWSWCPTSSTVAPRPAKRRTSACTLATSGQVASITRRLRSAQTRRTSGDTPWADRMIVWPSGTSWGSSTKTAPFTASDDTTCVLCTISPRT